MRTACVVGVALLAMLWTSTDVAADARGHGRSDGARVGGGRPFHGPGHSFHQRGRSFHNDRVGRHRLFPRHFRGLGVIVAPPAVVFSAPLYEPGPRYYSPPPVYAPPVATYSPMPYAPSAPPAPPRVVHYPTGRYELRGDGIATPYTWVWIPNPPPPPAPPAAPPADTPKEPAAPADALPTRQRIYHWVDEHGVAYWTNRVDRIPRRYREEAQR